MPSLTQSETKLCQFECTFRLQHVISVKERLYVDANVSLWLSVCHSYTHVTLWFYSTIEFFFVLEPV